MGKALVDVSTVVSVAGALWGLPNSLLGLAFAALSLSIPRPRDGVLVAISNRGLARVFLGKRGFSAITLGRIVVSVCELDQKTWVHELEHVAQTNRWGPMFLPAYLYWHARRGYRNNPFELRAVAKAEEFARAQATTGGASGEHPAGSVH